MEFKDMFEFSQHETVQKSTSKKTNGIISCLTNLIPNSFSSNEKEEQ